jgi:hypothetical protein
MLAGRNDPCPCESGAKYKRCCLDRELEVERIVGQLEEIVADLGEAMWEREPDSCAARFAEFYDGGLDAFGWAGPSSEELLEAFLWFLFDCPLPDGQTPLGSMSGRSRGHADELLARSELRAWRVESVAPGGVIQALCPLGGGRGRLELPREPLGELRPGALIVARSVPLGPERWTLLGRLPVVDPSVQTEFEELLASLEAPRGEVWRVHGGVLARTVWAWPEEREVTVDGEIVESMLVRFAVDDPARTAAALDADPELVPTGPDPYDGALNWRRPWTPPEPSAPAPEPGVVYEVCEEDTASEPWLADVSLDAGRGELWLFAPTPGRLALIEVLVRHRLGRLLGSVTSRNVEPPECVQRWKRLRWERTFERTARRYRRPRRRAAA